jgi:hypothetical protein
MPHPRPVYCPAVQYSRHLVMISRYLLVVTDPLCCSNLFIRMEYDPEMLYGYRVILSMIFVAQGIKKSNKANH